MKKSFWSDEEVNLLIQEFKTQIEHLRTGENRQKLDQELREGLNIDSATFRLYPIIETTANINPILIKTIREKVVSEIEKEFSKKLLEALVQIPQVQLPNKVQDELTNKLDTRDILYRLLGVLDTIMMAYDNEVFVGYFKSFELLFKGGLMQFQTRRRASSQQSTDDVLDEYEKTLIDLLQQKKDQTNLAIRNSLKNYLEMVKDDIDHIFKTNNPLIYAILSQKVTLSGEVLQEVQRNEIIKESFEAIERL